MATKLPRGQMPSGHSSSDFECFGPPAVKDGDFGGTKICDMGCFKQDGTDSNKFYHGAVVKSKIDGKYYAYFEYGRVGAPRPDFQFYEGYNESDAQAAYEKQLHAKNDKRGQWVTQAGLGKILQAKPKKDCYLVRPQATRSTGLPSASTITDGVKTVVKHKKSSGKKTAVMDVPSMQLINDLNMAAVQFTKASTTDHAIPTQLAIDECRNICAEATKVNNKLNDDVARLSNRSLQDLTSMIYSRIPKAKARGAHKDTWWLTPFNIQHWLDDLDAFETALQSEQCTVEHTEVPTNLPFVLKHLDHRTDTLGKFVDNWFRKATRNRHVHVRRLEVANIWSINRPDSERGFQRKLGSMRKCTKDDRVKHQFQRKDLDTPTIKQFADANTALLFHGTRTVNVSGILTNFFKLPKELSRTAITGAAFGTGVYFADDVKKSVGYTSSSGAIWAKGRGKVASRKLFMFMTDVILGHSHCPKHTGAVTSVPGGKDSIFACEGVSGWLSNNEYVIFDKNQINMRYLVEFST